MPALRLSRLRRTNAIRDWTSQTQVHPKNLVLPYFVVEGKGINEPIQAMPGVYHLSIDNLLKDIAEAQKLGIQSVLLFGISKTKDELGSVSYKKSGVVQRAVQAIKKKSKDLIVVTDVCLCGYTTHGHCGIVRPKTQDHRPQTKKSLKSEVCSPRSDFIDNDATLEVLAKIAVSHAECGADFVAPSAMMDGQVEAIRAGLDKNGCKHVGILAYSAKYASHFYGPFREAFDSRPQFGDRKSYQLDYRNSDEALREIKEDIEQGADIVMVKPALAYLDIIYRAKQKFNLPIAAYNVSGEYALVKAYCQSQEPKAKSQEKELVLEMLTAIKRAGADFIITYWAKDVARWLKH